MQQVRVAQELDIANLKNHVQRQPLARLLKNLHSPQLLLAERRNQALVREAGEGLDVVGIPLAVQSALAAVLNIHNRLTDPLLLALGDLALAVKVPDGLGQELGDVGVFLLKGVPYVVDRDDIRLAALLRAVHAEETDDVAVVGVEELARRGAVDADSVDLGRVVADVLDVAEHVAAPVLRDEVAQVGAQAHVGDGVLLGAPNVGGEVLKQNEALAVEQVVAEVLEDLAEPGQREVLLRDASQGSARGDEGVRRVGEFLDLFIGERVNPALGVVDEVLALPDGRARNLLGELGVGLQNVVEGSVLARGADAVGEDVAGGLVVDVGVLVLEDDGRLGLLDESSGSHFV